MALHESSGVPHLRQEGLDLFLGRGLLTATLIIAAIGANHSSVDQTKPIDNRGLLTLETTGPGFPLQTPQKTGTPNVPFLPKEKGSSERSVSEAAVPRSPAQVSKPVYPTFISNLKSSATLKRTHSLSKQPRPHNTHGLSDPNYHLSRSRGGDRYGKRVGS